MFERPGAPSDYFPSPFPNVKAAAAANGGAAPPDLSLMAKARAGGANFIHGILTGYEELVPDDVLQSIFAHAPQARQEEHGVALAESAVDQAAYADTIADAEPTTAPVAPAHTHPAATIPDP